MSLVHMSRIEYTLTLMGFYASVMRVLDTRDAKPYLNEGYSEILTLTRNSPFKVKD